MTYRWKMVVDPLTNLADAYRADAAELLRGRLSSGEVVLFAGNVAQADRYRYTLLQDFGYWILTTRRLFAVSFVPSIISPNNRPETTAHRVEKVDLRLVLPPTSALDLDELASRTVNELQLERVVDINWQALASESLAISELSIRAIPDDTVVAVVFTENDARMFYEKVSSSIEARATDARAGSGGIPALIRALGLLRDAELITNEEFEEKKRLLLDRI